MYQEIKEEIFKYNQIDRSITLVAVSKLQPVEKIEALMAQGQLDFGENYVQEALDKIEYFESRTDLRWHLIGSIQKNKVKYLKNYFHLIHSVDSIELAELISQKSLQIGHVQNILLQVKLADEDSKSGFSVEELLQSGSLLTALKGLRICGLMTMPPLQNKAEENKTYFRQLKTLLAQLQNSAGFAANRIKPQELSMGTSSDYHVALEEGATMVRLGTILFGERPKK